MNTDGLRDEVVKIVIDEIRAERDSKPFHDMDVYEEIGLNVAAQVVKLVNHTAKAYGGCTNCYGKGYATKQDFVFGGGKKWKASPIKYCTCERGNQLEKLVESLATQARIDELEALRGVVYGISATGTIEEVLQHIDAVVASLTSVTEDKK